MKQAVILCAGRGSRLAPLTDKIPKVLVEVDGVSLLEYKLKLLDGLVDEVILIIGYKGDMIREKFGDVYGGLKIKYCVQEKTLGSGHAILQAKDLLTDQFIVLNGDDFYLRGDLEKLLLERFAILGFEVDNPKSFGVLNIDERGHLVAVDEKPEFPKSNFVNIGVYAFDVSIFDKKLEKSSRGEYEIIDYLNYIISKYQNVRVLRSDFWAPVNDFDQLKAVGKKLKDINS